MSDFGELCPLFNTGVFNEITFPELAMTTVSASANALVGTNQVLTRTAVFMFGRTVVVTGAFVRQTSRGGTACVYVMKHHTTQHAVGTEFASICFSESVSGMEIATWVPMTVTEQTFTSAEVLGFTMGTATAANAGICDLIVRYKEK